MSAVFFFTLIRLIYLSGVRVRASVALVPPPLLPRKKKKTQTLVVAAVAATETESEREEETTRRQEDLREKDDQTKVSQLFLFSPLLSSLTFPDCLPLVS